MSWSQVLDNERGCPVDSSSQLLPGLKNSHMTFFVDLKKKKRCVYVYVCMCVLVFVYVCTCVYVCVCVDLPRPLSTPRPLRTSLCLF